MAKAIPPLDCSGCLLGTGLGKFVSYVGEEYSQGGVLVVGHSAYSRGNGNWLADFRTSQTGRYFEPLMERAGIPLDSLAVVNAYRCLLPDGRSAPTRGALNECSGRNFPRELEALLPGKIIAWGSPVSALLSGGLAEISDRGTEFEYNGVPVFAMYHPAYQITKDPKGERILPRLAEFLGK